MSRWLRQRTPRWRVALVVLGMLFVSAAAAAVFTTFDSVASAGVSCGSPLRPKEGVVPAGCGEELGHARATRTAALTWALVLLGSCWAVEVAGRRPDGQAADRTSASGNEHCRVGYQDDFWWNATWPLYGLDADATGMRLRKLSGEVSVAWPEVERLVRCGIGPQWAVRVVLADGRRWVLWSPRLTSVLAVAPAVLRAREPRRILAMWQQRKDAS